MNRKFTTWCRCFLLSVCIFPLQLEAGNLWLNNGDIISGEPEELSGGVLRWISDSAGPLEINQFNILLLQSDREVLFQMGEEKLLDGCRFEIDDGKPAAPLVDVKVEQGENASTELADLSENIEQDAEEIQLQPESGTDPRAGSDVAVQPPKDVAEAPPEPQRQQWIMCEDTGFPLTSWRQVSRFFEFKPPEPDKVRATGKAVLFVEDESGNTNERTIEIDVVAQFRYRKRRHIFTIENDVESSSGTDTKDERKLTYQFDRFITERWFWAGNGSWEENKFKDLSSKWIIASGPGYQFFETDLLHLSFQGGLAYINEKYNDDDERDFPALRAATDFSWQLTENGLKFIHTNLIYQSLKSTNNWVIETDTGLTMPILNAFKAEFVFEYDYDNYPSSSAEKEDRVLKMGFSYNW